MNQKLLCLPHLKRYLKSCPNLRVWCVVCRRLHREYLKPRKSIGCLQSRFQEAQGGGFGPLVPMSLYILILQFLFLLVAQWILRKIRKLLEEYQKFRSEIQTPPQNPTKLQKWLEKSRFYKMTDLLLAFTTLTLTPELFGNALQNISNRWARTILSLIVPLVRLFFSCGLFLGTSVVSLKTLGFLSRTLQSYSTSLFRFIPAGTISNAPVLFMELLLKCAICGFLSGVICRNFFQWSPRDRQQNLLALGATVSCAIGLYYVSTDTVYLSQISTKFAKTEIGTFFLKSQLNRIALLLGCTRALAALEELSYTLYFFFFFICFFQVYSLAFTATPNLF